MILNLIGLICLLFLLNPGRVMATPLLSLELVATGLNRPVAITHAGDGSGRLFLTLQAGQILIYDGTQVLSPPFLDISALVSCCRERGLLSVAFHPDYERNGFFYVNYTNILGDTVIARYTASADPNVADPNSALILLTIAQPFANHNGGQLQFGPDGYLYIGMGDGGSGGDPQNNAQNPGVLLGKLLRIDVDHGTPYSIPPDNPFVDNPEVRDEIWALGLRNPWRFSFDRLTGDLFIGDVGQNDWEEVDFQPANSAGGENYGWRLMEGNHCFNPSVNCNNGSLILPILEYSHSLGCSITGGYRYRGTRNPQFYGTYFYGDYCTGRIWGATGDENGQWTTAELLDTDFSISTFGEDENGEIYLAHLATNNGAIYRLVGNLDCAGLEPTIVGTESDDVLTGTAEADIIHGLGGQDIIFGLNGNDVLCGGLGEDTLYGGHGDDELFGESGDDILIGGPGKDTLAGGSDNDLLIGGQHNDVLQGEGGKDVLFGGNGNDTLRGGDEGDILHGGSGEDVLSGNNGNDALRGGDGDDMLEGDEGIDICDGGAHTTGDTALASCELILHVP